MGRDKALLVVGGRALARIAADALDQAGAAEVFAVGGDATGLEAVGLRAVADPRQGQGPLGGLLSALDAAAEDVVVVLACDLPHVTAEAVGAVLAGLDDPDADVAVALVAQRRQHLLGAWRRDLALERLGQAYAEGERAIWRAARPLRTREVTLRADSWADDVDDAAGLLDIDPPG